MRQPGPDTSRQPPGPNPQNRPPTPPSPNRPPQPPPVRAAKLPPIGAFGGGFGPAGSGGYSTGSTPVPVRSNDDHPELPTVKDQEKKRPAFLVEGDDDEMFGSGEFTAPQVIGE